MERMSILDNYYGEGKSIRDKIEELEEENQTLKDKIEFLTNCLDDRDKSIEIMKEENRKLREERDELDRINHNLNAKLSDLYDVKQILRDIVININRLNKLKEIVFKYDAKPKD